MMRNYENLLPEYLDGPHIKNHASIIDAQNKILYDEIKLCELNYFLDRPIVIKWEQNDPHTAHITVYCNTKDLIKKVEISGQHTHAMEFAESDAQTQYTYTFAYTNVEIGAHMPNITVTLETYDNTTYKKGYPENDTKQNNNKDHDEFLDRVGALLNIPRITYKKVNHQDGRTNPTEWFNNLCPPYFYKTSERASTEDDYYYIQRMKFFIQNYPDMPLMELMHNIIFLDDAKVYTFKYRNTYLSDFNDPYLFDADLQIVASRTKAYTNIDDTNKFNILQKYAPLTRQLIPFPKLDIGIDVTLNKQYANETEITGGLTCELKGVISPVRYAPVKLYAFSVPAEKWAVIDEVTTDNDGLFTSNFGGLPLYMNGVKYVVDGKYEFNTLDTENETETDIYIDTQLSMDLTAWHGGQYANTQASQVKEPFLNNDGFVCVGRRYLCITPVINPKFYDLSALTVEVYFRYTKNYQKIGLVTVRQNQDGTYTQTTQWITPYDILGAGDYTATHMLEFKFKDGIMYTFLDGDYTGQHTNWNGNNDIIYLAGYNIDNVTPTLNNGLYFEDAYIYDYVNINENEINN